MKPRTKLIALASGLVVAAVAYTGVWFYFAGELQDRANAYITGLTGQGIAAACTNLDVVGYPLDIGLSCDAIGAENRRDGSSVQAGAFRAMAQMGRPHHVVSKLDGPLSAIGPRGSRVTAKWSVMHASTVFRNNGLRRGDFQAKEFEATLTGPLVPATVHLESPEFEAHTRQHGRDLDAAFTVNKLSLNSSGPLGDLPVVDLSGTATLNGMAKLLSGREPIPDHLLRGTSGTLTAFSMNLGNGATLSLAGPFSFDTDGRLSGRFNLEIAGLSSWQQAIGAILPETRETIADAAAMLTALAGQSGTAKIIVTADHGRLSLGLIPLGKLPPI
ncbi:MAG TPA: DUF2125 domain-containing protein [Pararhizobium sp.]|nr:DUF2125 domain-containing protein [Pararhizobium sp.]